MKSFFHTKILPFLVWAFYQIWRSTWRITFVEPKEAHDGTPLILAHWHSDIVPLLHLLIRYRAATIASTSKDGDLIDGVIQRLGAKAARGSSTRHGAGALKGIVRLAREGYRPAIAVDGPKGPLHEVKPGVFEISKLTGAPIYPLVAVASRSYIFPRSWDKTFLPLPFSKVIILWGEPLGPVDRSCDGRDPILANDLVQRINAAKHQASNLIAAHKG